MLAISTKFTVEEYWTKVLQLKNSVGYQLYSNLKIVTSLLLVLPFSNVSVESIFTTSKGIEKEEGCVKFTHTE